MHCTQFSFSEDFVIVSLRSKSLLHFTKTKMSTFNFSKDNLPKQLIINNEYVDSKSNKKLTVKNPKDGSLIADDVPLAGEEDVDRAVAAAEKVCQPPRNLFLYVMR